MLLDKEFLFWVPAVIIFSCKHIDVLYVKNKSRTVFSFMADFS